jgi:molybdopterin-guanine dinucleotide biosynthesis protein A
VTRLGALILAGGASRRMGADKAAQDWGGFRAIDRVEMLAVEAGARPVLVCGADLGLPFVPDPFPQAGPVAGLLAGASALRRLGCERCLVLAVDAPTLRPSDLTPLFDAAEGAAFAEFPLPMVLPLDAVPPDAEADWPLRRFVERAGLRRPPCAAGAEMRIRGANTHEERQRLLADLADGA